MNKAYAAATVNSPFSDRLQLWMVLEIFCALLANPAYVQSRFKIMGREMSMDEGAVELTKAILNRVEKENILPPDHPDFRFQGYTTEQLTMAIAFATEKGWKP